MSQETTRNYNRLVKEKRILERYMTSARQGQLSATKHGRHEEAFTWGNKINGLLDKYNVVLAELSPFDTDLLDRLK